MFFRYIKEHIKNIGLFLGFLFLLFIIFYLNNIAVDLIFYSFLLMTFLACIYGGSSFYINTRKHFELQQVKKNLDEELNTLPEPKTILEEDYKDIIEGLFHLKQEIISNDAAKYQEMLDYYEMWVHQIKVPIASMSVLLQSAQMTDQRDAKRIRELKSSLLKIEQYVEMVLSYLRFDSETTDYLFGMYDLDVIIKHSLHSFSTIFAMHSLNLHYESKHSYVLTDKKWLIFVVKQLISNALKYTKKGGISITTREEGKKVCLIISDTGIGIKQEDIPRLFEKGFTGYNGRIEKKSTGIGLYLCKKILDTLGHRIWITSKRDEGTNVYIEIDNTKLDVSE